MRLIFLLFLLVHVFSSWAQSNSGSWELRHFGLEDGVSSNDVLHVLPDPNGFIWAGSTEGLNRYDGYDFDIWYRDELDSTSLGTNNVAPRIIDSKGQIWLTSRENLNCFNPTKGSSIRYFHNREDTSYLPGSQSNWVLEDRKNTIWIGTNEGLARLNEDGSFKRFIPSQSDLIQGSHSLQDWIRFMASDPINDSLIWLATRRGTWSFNIYSHQFGDPAIDKGSEFSLNRLEHWALSLEADGTIWIGTYGHGLIKYDRKDKSWNRFEFPKETPFKRFQIIHDLVRKSKEELWIGSSDQGLGIFNQKTESYYFFLQIQNRRTYYEALRLVVFAGWN